MQINNNKVEVNPDGTAHCERCFKDKPVEGFVAGWSGGRSSPPEWMQVCKDCQQQEEEKCKALDEMLENVTFEDVAWLGQYRSSQRANARVPSNYTGD